MFATCPSNFRPFPWLEWAFLALGYQVREGRDRPIIADFLRYAGINGDGDQTPWCSAFVNYCMEQVGIQGTRMANARSWLGWGGMSLASPQIGCVAVLWRGSPSSAKGHVGFYTGFHSGNLLMLGGNQGNAVTVEEFPMSRVLGYRWPIHVGRGV